MSSYQLSDEQLSALARAITRKIHHRNLGHLVHSVAGCGSEELASKLHAMNDRAVRRRYGDAPAPSFAYQPGRTPEGLHALWYGLGIYLYQCTEDDEPESDLYRRLEELRSAVASELIYSMSDSDHVRDQWHSL